MGLIVIQGGQTGVDRGAARASLDLGVKFGGWLPSGALCESGRVPAWVSANMREIANGGLLARALKNLEIATFLLAVVPDRGQPYGTPGTRIALQRARSMGLKAMAVYLGTPISIIAMRVKSSVPEGWPIRLMVAGPRASLWPQAEQMAYQIVWLVLEAIK